MTTKQKDMKLIDYLLLTYSKKHVKNFLKYKQVTVNGVTISQFDYLVHSGDKVEIVKDKKTNLDIIYEDDDFVVINKPAGLLSTKTVNQNKTAYDEVGSYLKSKREKAYLVHRLDQDTSGVLMFCKNEKLKKALQQDWNKLVLKRGYLAIVEGHLKDKNGTVVNYLNESKTRQVYLSNKQEGKKCITHYKVLKENKLNSLVEVFIDTGRKNQIRVTMQSLDCSIVGDKKYEAKTNPLKRLGLHAFVLEFKHPFNKKIYKFEAKEDNDFRLK